MKNCVKCGAVLYDENKPCPYCEGIFNEELISKDFKYCSKCGAKVLKEAVLCVKCGCMLENKNKLLNNKSSQDDEKLEKPTGWIGLVKLLLLAAIIIFALVDYRLLSFSKGFSEIPNNEEQNFTDTVKTIIDIEAIEYYKNPISNEDDQAYVVYVITKEKACLLTASESEIAALDFLGIFADNFKPKEISPIPFYYEIIAGIVILIIPPFIKRK